MLTCDFDFKLPSSLIAQRPLSERSASKMLIYHRQYAKVYTHTYFYRLIDYLNPGDLLIFNHSKVIPARLYATKMTGGRVEILVERCIDDTQFTAHIRSRRPVLLGLTVYLSASASVTVLDRVHDLYRCVANQPILDLLKQYGQIPLPPYIKRVADQEDVERYQTVYAHQIGSVAAPTAGLHFDTSLLTQLKNKGIDLGYVTLHIGSGTFQPVRTSSITDHVMHAEWMEIDESLCLQVNQKKARHQRIIAVGSTVLRALESAARGGQLYPYHGDTSIFITPGYPFQIVDGFMTNFHLPKTTLFILVSAWMGCQEAKALYQEAIMQQYRFFSYGDVSLLL